MGLYLHSHSATAHAAGVSYSSSLTVPKISLTHTLLHTLIHTLNPSHTLQYPSTPLFDPHHKTRTQNYTHKSHKTTLSTFLQSQHPLTTLYKTYLQNENPLRAYTSFISHYTQIQHTISINKRITRN